jgi:diacylglycerol kinase family enzyme
MDLAAVGNGCYFGGGMRVAPDARPDDGLFDVVWIRGSSRAKLVRKLPLLYQGRHVGLPEVSVRRGTVVEAEPARPDADVRIEIDGEPLGGLPVRFELLPGALTLCGVDP